MKIVYLGDEKIEYDRAQSYFEQVADWAKIQCVSFVDYHVQDVSDVSGIYDHVAAYKFLDAKDAIWFELKWK